MIVPARKFCDSCGAEIFSDGKAITLGNADYCTLGCEPQARTAEQIRAAAWADPAEAQKWLKTFCCY